MSLHGADLRVGGTSPEPLGELAFPGNGFDYGRMLDLWAAQFGRAQVCPGSTNASGRTAWWTTSSRPVGCGCRWSG